MLTWPAKTRTRAMRVLIASGKGGAGKTTVTASLARVWPGALVLADADAEAPNLALYVPGAELTSQEVTMKVPGAIDYERCSDCGKCLDVCQFKAIARLGDRIVAFSNMCHGCGACFALCEDNAIEEDSRLLGHLFVKQGEQTPVLIEACSKIGEAMTPPLLRELNSQALALCEAADADLLMDAPPGVSCPVMTAARACEAIVLVAEPSPFGFYDLGLALQAFEQTAKPVAIVLNRAGLPQAREIEEKIHALCERKQIPILGVLPFDRAAAQQYSDSKVLADMDATWKARFESIAQKLIAWVKEVEHA